MWMQSGLKTKKAFSIFWATTQRRNCRNVHGIEVAKMKLSTELAREVQMAEVLSTTGYTLLALPKIKETKPFYRWLRKLQDFNTSSWPPQKPNFLSKNYWLEHIAPRAGNPKSTLCRAYNFKKNLQTCLTLLSALSSALVFCGSSPVAPAPPTASGLSSFFPSIGGSAFCWGNVDCGFCFCFLLLCLCLDPLPFSGWAY